MGEVRVFVFFFLIKDFSVARKAFFKKKTQKYLF